MQEQRLPRGVEPVKGVDRQLGGRHLQQWPRGRLERRRRQRSEERRAGEESRELREQPRYKEKVLQALTVDALGAEGKPSAWASKEVAPRRRCNRHLVYAV